jgi:hypothetical protein
MTFLDAPVHHHRPPFEQVIAHLKRDAIALNESLLEPDAFTRATAEGWRQYYGGLPELTEQWLVSERVRAAVARAAQETKLTESEVVEEVLSDWAGVKNLSPSHGSTFATTRGSRKRELERSQRWQSPSKLKQSSAD